MCLCLWLPSERLLSAPSAGLCSEFPGRCKIPCRPLPHSPSLTAGEQAQALQGFSLSFCTGERSKRILSPMIVTCTNCMNTSCAFKEYYVWSVKGSTAVEGGVHCRFSNQYYNCSTNHLGAVLLILALKLFSIRFQIWHCILYVMGFFC